MSGAGPGPGAYLLPPTVGYNRHDPSRYRNPQYSIASKQGGAFGGAQGPGPTYDVANMTRYGKANTPAFSIASRKKELTAFSTPGPGTYHLDGGKTHPAYTMASRYPGIGQAATPAPNQYTQPSSLGPKVPHKPASAAYSIVGNHGFSSKQMSPGPATYGGTPLDNYKWRTPKFTIHDRCKGPASGDVNPGPAAYLPKLQKGCMGGFSFGTRTMASPYITADDYVPCIRRETKK